MLSYIAIQKEVFYMYYCFIKNMKDSDDDEYIKKYCSLNNTAIFYSINEDKFYDKDNNVISISSKKIFPKTWAKYEEAICDAIKKHGGLSIVSKEEIIRCLNWYKYYNTKRKLEMLKGRDLLDYETINRIKEEYGNIIFFKTIMKDYSGNLNVEYLKDKESLISRTLSYHLDDEFIISEKVKITKDDLGQKEYRLFVVDEKITSISRTTPYVFHKIEPHVYEEAKKIVEKAKLIASSFVMDIFEYEKDDEIVIDVVEFNPIVASGLYLYNSLIDLSDNNILHDDVYLVGFEQREKLKDLIEMDYKIIKSNPSKLFNSLNTFAGDLKSIYVSGEPGTISYDIVDTITDDMLKKHGSIMNILESSEVSPKSVFSDMQQYTADEIIELYNNDQQYKKIKK